MNRQKYVNDESYREGYIDGQKEGINKVVNECLPLINDNIESLRKLKYHLLATIEIIEIGEKMESEE